MHSFLPRVVAVINLVCQLANALPIISVKGAKFFAGGQQFFLKGVAYQGTPADPLVDTNQCSLDAAYMQAIGTNSIRVYHVDPTQNHDGCMSVFNDAGIYVWLDLDTFDTTVVQTNPTWTQAQLVAFAKVMDVFQDYENLGGFWIGNEVINNAAGSIAAPYIKAAAADMKNYMTAKKYRQIPIGYSAADIAELRPMLQNYLACGDPSLAVDFFGLNSYEWCGAATYQTSGYINLQAMTQNYNLPIFFSETGCNVRGNRTFQDQYAIFGPDMIDTWSGSIIYEWVEETNMYGLVTYANGIYSGTPISVQPDYDNLEAVWKNINPTGIAEASYSPSLGPPACPMASNGWAINGDVPLPTLGSAIVNSVAANQLITKAPAPTTTTSVAPAVPMTTAAVSTSTETISTISTSIVSNNESQTVSSTPKASTSHSAADRPTSSMSLAGIIESLSAGTPQAFLVVVCVVLGSIFTIFL